MPVPAKLDDFGDIDRIKKWQAKNPKSHTTKKTAQCPVNLVKLEKTHGKRNFNDVWEIDVDEVRFNPYNGRLVGKQLWASKLDQEKRTNRGKIAMHMLDNAEFTANDAKDLKAQLRQDGQTMPAIALADGVILEGNTRLAALMQLGKKTIDVFFLPKELPMLEAERIEWFMSFERVFQKQWGPYQRANAILEKVRHLSGTTKPTADEIEDAMKDTELEDLLEDVNMGPKNGKLDYNDGPIHHCRALIEAEIYLKKYNEKVKTKQDLDWIDDTADGGPGFSVFMSDVLSTLAHAHDDVEREKTRKIIHNRLRAHTKGELKGERNASHIVDPIRQVRNALIKDHDEFLDNIPITAANWTTKTITTAIGEEAEKVIQGAKSKKRSTATQKKLEGILEKLEKIKDKDLKKESKGILKPIVKKITAQVKHIAEKVK